MNKSEAHAAAIESLEDLMRLILENVAKRTQKPIVEFDPERFKFILQVDGRDHGRIVGKGGRVIGALEAIFWYAGMVAIKHTVGIELLDPEERRRDLHGTPFVLNKNWDRDRIGKMLGGILTSCLGEKNQSWAILDNGEHSVARVKINKYLQKGLGYPNPHFETALGIIVRAAGMASGANLTTEVVWE